MRFAFARQRQRRQRPRRRGRRHPRADRLRLRPARHGRRGSRGSGLEPTALDGDPRHPRALRPRRRRAPRSPARHGIAVWVTVRHACCGRRQRFDGHGPAFTVSTATTPSRSAISRSPRCPCRTTRASRCSSSLGDGDAPPRRADRHRHVARRTSRPALSGCDALVLESNHDLDLLAGERLSDRAEGSASPGASATSTTATSGRAARAASTHAAEAHRRRAPLAAEQHARPGARGARRGARLHGDWIGVADQAEGFDWRDI